MKKSCSGLILIILTSPWFNTLGQSASDSLRYRISANYTIDLSDSYGGGQMFASELGISKSWYGANISYGHFMSQANFILQIPLEQSGYILDIMFEEMAIMKMGALSLEIIPVQGKKISAELLFGGVYAKAELLCAKGVEYTFDTVEEKFTSLMRDYQLVKSSDFGYQVGLRLSYYLLKNAGLELDLRMQDLRNGGTFFFTGAGLCIKL